MTSVIVSKIFLKLFAMNWAERFGVQMVLVLMLAIMEFPDAELCNH